MVTFISQRTTGHFYKILFACEKEGSTLWVSAEAMGEKSKHVTEENYSWHTHIKAGFRVSVPSHWRLMYVKWPRQQNTGWNSHSIGQSQRQLDTFLGSHRQSRSTMDKIERRFWHFFQSKHRVEPGRKSDLRVGKEEKRGRRILILLLFLLVRAAEVTGFCVNQAEIVCEAHGVSRRALKVPSAIFICSFSRFIAIMNPQTITPTPNIFGWI